MSGALPFSTHCSSAVSSSKSFGPSPPPQCAMPGAMNSRYDACTFDAPPFVAATRCRSMVLRQRRDLRVAPAVVLNQLAAAVEERLEVRIERVDRRRLATLSARATSRRS